MESVRQLGQQWQYKVIRFYYSWTNIEFQLNILGMQGWELVSAEWGGEGTYCTYTFKKTF